MCHFESFKIKADEGLYGNNHVIYKSHPQPNPTALFSKQPVLWPTSKHRLHVLHVTCGEPCIYSHLT